MSSDTTRSNSAVANSAVANSAVAIQPHNSDRLNRNLSGRRHSSLCSSQPLSHRDAPSARPSLMLANKCILLPVTLAACLILLYGCRMPSSTLGRTGGNFSSTSAPSERTTSYAHVWEVPGLVLDREQVALASGPTGRIAITTKKIKLSRRQVPLIQFLDHAFDWRRLSSLSDRRMQHTFVMRQSGSRLVTDWIPLKAVMQSGLSDIPVRPGQTVALVAWDQVPRGTPQLNGQADRPSRIPIVIRGLVQRPGRHHVEAWVAEDMRLFDGQLIGDREFPAGEFLTRGEALLADVVAVKRVTPSGQVHQFLLPATFDTENRPWSNFLLLKNDLVHVTRIDLLPEVLGYRMARKASGLGE